MALVVFDGLVARRPPRPSAPDLPRATSLSGSRGAFLWGRAWDRERAVQDCVPDPPAFLSPSLAAMLTHAAHRLARAPGGDS